MTEAGRPNLPRTWDVLDSTGRWLWSVGVPDRFFPYGIGPDWVLGVEVDDLDVEYVVLYPLRKPAIGSRE